MDRARLRRIYDLHTWTGIVCGLFIFIVSLSGVFALFEEELRSWEDERLRIAVADTPLPVMPIVTGFVAEVTQGGDLLDLSVHLPTRAVPLYSATAVVRHADSGVVETIERQWNPNNGVVIPPRGNGFVHWIVDFHRNLMLERTIGRLLVGLAGIALMLSIVSGIVTHRKILAEWLTWRLDRSVRLRWQDSHKILGLWGIAFHTMIGFTGAWLGVIAVIVPLTAAISFQGDKGALFEAVFGPQPVPAGQAASMTSIDAAAQRVAQRTGAHPESLSVSLWGDAAAEYTFFYHAPDTLLGHGRASVDAVTGEVTDVTPTRKPGFVHRILPAMVTLHYALFGGLVVKFLYVLLGLALCVLTATGLMLWIERRRHGNAGRYPAGFYGAVSRASVGVCAGMGLASFATFYADKLAPAGADGRITIIGTVYFGVWLLAVLYACMRGNEYRSCKELLAATALAALGLPLLNALVTGQDMFTLLRAGHVYAAGADIAGIVTGLSLLLAARWIPASRPQRARKLDTAAATR